MFSVLSDFVRRSVVIALCYFFIVFGSLLFAKQWGEYVIKTKVFWMIPIWHLQILMKIWCRKRDFGRWMFRPRSINFEGNRCCFSTISLFNNVMIFVARPIATISCKIENERFSLYPLQKFMISMIILQNLKVKYWILAGTYSTNCIIIIEILGWCH